MFLCAAALAASLALAACSGSGTTTTSSSPATSAAASTSSSQTPTSATSTSTVTSTASAPAPAATSSAASTSSAGSTCQTRNLRLSVVSAEGAAGTAYTTYALTNVGDSSCTMIGYPGVSVLNAAGQIVQHPARRGADQPAPVTLLTLAAGAPAHFLVNSTDVIPSPGCPTEYTGVTLQVYPPNQRTAIVAPYKGTFCDLKVGPVQAGS